MTTRQKNAMVAESAIKLLRQAIDDDNKNKILAAYDIVEDLSFNWIGLDALFSEWDSLIDKANSILFL